MPFAKGTAMTYIAVPKAPKETVTELRRIRDDLVTNQRRAKEQLYAADHALRMNDVALATQKSIAKGHKLFKVRVEGVMGPTQFYTFAPNDDHIRNTLWHYVADANSLKITLIMPVPFSVPED